jgi:hypothetical protein
MVSAVCILSQKTLIPRYFCLTLFNYTYRILRLAPSRHVTRSAFCKGRVGQSDGHNKAAVGRKRLADLSEKITLIPHTDVVLRGKREQKVYNFFKIT